jgi:CubicO group peptidase (beta-lactamase class C family)
MLIERVTGHSWAADIDARFSTPLGLPDTRVCDSRPTDPRAAHGYMRTSNAWTRYPYISMTQPYAAGSLCSTLRDLVKWNRLLATGKVVALSSYSQMTTPEGAARAAGYGYGLSRQMQGSHVVITHGGGVHGFVSANLWVPDAGLSVTVFANGSTQAPGQLAERLTRAALGIASPSDQRVAASAAELARYAGVYALELPTGARDFTFTVRDGDLYGQLAGQGANPLIPLGDHVFGAEFDPTLRIRFVLDGERVTGLVLEQRGQRFEGKRR